MMRHKRRWGGAVVPVIVVLAIIACAAAWFGFHYARARPAAAGTVLLVSGDTAGWITPCGCTSNQSGGLPRRGTYVKDLRKASQLIYLDAGGAAGGNSDYQKVKFEAILQGEKEMGINAHNLGKAELAMGAQYLREVKTRLAFPFVSDNARDAEGKKFVEERMTVEAGDIRVGIIGVVSPRYATAGIKIDDPRQAILDAAGAMKGHCQFIVVLAYLPEEELTQLAAGLPEIDAIVGGPTGQAMTPRMVGPTMLASATNKGKFLVELRGAAGKGGAAWDGKVVEMGPALADDSAQIANVKRYLQTLAEKDFSAQQSGLVEATPVGAPMDYKIAGSSACMKCHAAEYGQWKGSKHAHALETLQQKGFHVDSQCQLCHTTGYGLAGGFVSMKQSGAGELGGVGCENCHGPSSAHVKDPKQRTPFAAVDQCARCHDHENSPHFEYALYWEKIKHGKAADAGGKGSR